VVSVWVGMLVGRGFIWWLVGCGFVGYVGGCWCGWKVVWLLTIGVRWVVLVWVLVVVGGQNWGVVGCRTRGFVWASKREAEKWHTETRSNLADFCLAEVRELVREGLVYNRLVFVVFWCFGVVSRDYHAPETDSRSSGWHQVRCGGAVARLSRWVFIVCVITSTSV